MRYGQIAAVQSQCLGHVKSRHVIGDVHEVKRHGWLFVHKDFFGDFYHLGNITLAGGKHNIALRRYFIL